jgi:putative tryptophan/tyrosine transport system substrate-binding protein
MKHRIQFLRRRREFISLLGGAAAAWPLVAGAQQAVKGPTIGLLGTSTASEWVPFAQRFRELGWIEGRNVTVAGRWAQGRTESYAEIAAELVRLKVDVIVTTGAAVVAAKQATSTIPIVFAVAVDPLGTGLVSSLGRPGGNVTGLSLQQSDLVGKRLELFREIVPGFRRLGLMANVDYPAAAREMGQVRELASTLNMEVTTLEIQQAKDIEFVFDGLHRRLDVLYVVVDPLIFVNRLRLNTLALAARIPTAFGRREYIEAGGLMSYGPNFPDLYRRAAEIVDKILRGTRPADIPVEQPTKFDLVINLKSAKALGLDVPPTLLVRADEVIE